MTRVITRPLPLRTADYVHANRVGPSAGFNGTAGSGFGGAYTAVPTDPTRTTAKPICRLLVPDRQAFTSHQLVGVYAGANDGGSLLNTMGLASVTFCYEGRECVVTKPSFQNIVDANGINRLYWGWWCWLEHNGVNGGGNLYIKTTPRDVTMQNRVMGPYVFLPSAAVYDRELTVAPSLAVVAGSRYQTIADALEYIRLNTATIKHPRITVVEAGRYPIERGPNIFACDGYVTIEATVPIEIGSSGTVLGSMRPRVNGLRFRGSNITLDFAYNLCLLWETTLPGTTKHWMDGCNLTNSLGRAALVGGFTYFQLSELVYGSPWTTECSFSEVPEASCAASLARSNTYTNCYGDLMNGCACLIGNTTIDFTSRDHSTEIPALTVQYAGAGTGTIAMTGGSNGSSRVITLKVAGASIGTFAVSVTNSTGGFYWVHDVVAWINTFANWTATTLDDTRRASVLSLAGLAGWGAFGDTDCKTAPLTLITAIDIHTDYYQLQDSGGTPYENVVFVDNTGDGVEPQHFFLTGDGGAKDWLLINNSFHNTDSVALSQFKWAHSHVVMVHNTLSQQQLSMRTDLGGSAYTSDSYCLIANNAVPALNGGVTPVVIANNHLQSIGVAPSWSTGTTIGGDDPDLFVDAPNRDFTPQGALLTNLKAPVVKYDQAHVLRGATAPAGALTA